MEHLIKANKVYIQIYPEDNSKFEMYLGELVQVILIVLNNAIDAVSEKQQDKKKIEIYIMKEADKHMLVVKDNGGGIKDENMDKIFNPFFTTKFKSKGIGVGLYMAKMIIEQSMKGTLVAENTKSGAKFTVTL